MLNIFFGLFAVILLVEIGFLIYLFPRYYENWEAYRTGRGRRGPWYFVWFFSYFTAIALRSKGSCQFMIIIRIGFDALLLCFCTALALSIR